MDRLDLYLIRHAPTISPKGVVPLADPDADLSDQSAFRQLAGQLPVSAMWMVSPETLPDDSGNTFAIQVPPQHR